LGVFYESLLIGVVCGWAIQSNSFETSFEDSAKKTLTHVGSKKELPSLMMPPEEEEVRDNRSSSNQK
jgi:hypothetical protein